MADHPLVRHEPAATFAWRDRAAVSAAQVLPDVSDLACRLPERRYVINQCADRDRFAAGFAAALLGGQESLMPPNYTAHVVEGFQVLGFWHAVGASIVFSLVAGLLSSLVQR